MGLPVRVLFRDRPIRTNFAGVVTNVPRRRARPVTGSPPVAQPAAVANCCTVTAFRVLCGAWLRVRGTPVALCHLRRAIVHNAW